MSKTLTGGNRGYAEKLYLQDIILSTISKETSEQLVFKGGTALLKFYQLDRFSEDLDFTMRQEIKFEELVDKIARDLENYGAEVAERKEDEKDSSYRARLGIQGPLYTGNRRSLNFIRIEINRKSTASNFRNRRYNPKFRDITSFEVLVLDREEILAEKIRALVTRSQPRDLYDLYHLLAMGTEIDTELVKEKLEYYSLEYSREMIIKEAGKLEKNWETLETLTYSSPPAFEESLEKLEEKLPGTD
ncbi:MAG: nucleotidyl transferase AbiEii/AbiGii toxin family protein [Candidatus Nanohaloarchaea archaeon]